MRFTPEDTAAFYRRPAAEDDARLLEFRRVEIRRTDLNGTPQPPETVGYLEKYTGTLRGSRRSHEFTFILDEQQSRIGLVSEGGEFYRYTRTGRAEHLITEELERGLRTFFDLPARTMIELKSINIYSDY